MLIIPIRIISIIFLICTSKFLIGCAVVDWFSPSSEVTTTQSEASVSEQKKYVEAEGIEIVWQASNEPVKKYHIYYGTDINSLEFHVEVPFVALDRFEHPVYGPSYSYVLTGVPSNKEIFVSLSAENHFGESTRSAPIKVEPNVFQ
jgi:hypothetical protein